MQFNTERTHWSLLRARRCWDPWEPELPLWLGERVERKGIDHVNKHTACPCAIAAVGEILLPVFISLPHSPLLCLQAGTRSPPQPGERKPKKAKQPLPPLTSLRFLFPPNARFLDREASTCSSPTPFWEFFATWLWLCSPAGSQGSPPKPGVAQAWTSRPQSPGHSILLTMPSSQNSPPGSRGAALSSALLPLGSCLCRPPNAGVFKEVGPPPSYSFHLSWGELI